MPPTPEHQIFQLITGYAKIYPGMTKLFTYPKPLKVRIPGYEPRKIDYTKRKSEYVNPMSLIDSLRRTKTRISDIIISNEFDMFCTFTFNCRKCPNNKAGQVCWNEPCICDPETCRRYDVEFLKKRMSNWLNNQEKRVGKFKYIIVPEFHKDGKAIHFHALFKGYQGQLVDTGHKTKRGQISYQLNSYTIGYSTVVLIDSNDIDKVGNYCKKYITKDMPQFRGKKRYWCSHGLIRPDKVQNPVVFPYQKEKFTDIYETKDKILIETARERLDLIPQSMPSKQELLR